MFTKWRHLPTWQTNLWTAVAAELLTLLGFQAGFILIPYYIQEMGITDATQVAAFTGTYQSLGSLGLAIFTPIWGMLGDRHGRKSMLVRATAATAVIVMLTGLARTPTQLLVLRLLQGCLTGTPAAASALVAAGSPKEHLAYALGLIQTSLFIGQSLGPMFGGYIGDAYGYRATFFVSGAIILASLVLVILVAREPEREPLVEVERAQAARKRPLDVLRGVASPRLLALIGMTLTFNLTFSFLSPIIPLLIQGLVADSGRLASTAGTITGVTAFASALSALIVGKLSTRFGCSRTLMGCSIGTAVLYLPLVLVRSVLGLGTLLGIQGLFRGGISPSTSAMVVEVSPRDKTGTVLGFNSSAASVGYGLGPILGAALLSVSSSSTVFFVACGMMGLVTVGVFLADKLAGSDVQPSGQPVVEAQPKA
ncbi:MAG: multidrug efflux MFS transporter [Chloroflexi bacterium]|nr:multidrug efflux MFS transporter [Chloroflexota bacterium]